MDRIKSLRKFTPGLDLPAWFYYNLKSIDENFHLIYHPFEVLWDDIINEDYGTLADPRFTIHKEHGELNFGFVLTDGQGNPKKDGTWHLWRWADNAPGFAHIVKVESKDPKYLNTITNRLYLQAIFRGKSKTAWRERLLQEEQDKQEKDFKAREARFSDIQDENSWLTKKAMENFDRGVYKPTNPTKEIITSYSGQKNRSRIVRPITDEEGGLV